MKSIIDHHIKILNKNKRKIKRSALEFSNKIIEVILNGNKILLAGNGGSASDAQHISTELTVRLKRKRPGLPLISLVTDTSALTAIGNDLSFDKIFSRQINAIGKTGDIFIGISTSGNSKNIINAFKEAKKKNMINLGILGNGGGKSKEYCDLTFFINEKSPSRVQEIHILFYHSFCEIIEDFFFRKFNKKKKY